MKRVLLGMVLGLLLTACAGDRPAIKPQLPSRIILTYRTEEMGNRAAIPLTVRYTPLEPVRRAVLRLELSGPITAGTLQVATRENPEVGRELTAPVTVSATGDGEAEVRVVAEVENAKGDPPYMVAAYVQLLVTPEQILPGERGHRELHREHLAHLRSTGRLSQQEYEAEMRKLESKGATIRVIPPDPAKP